MAHKKAAGSAKNLRDSQPKYRGVKIFGGQSVSQGSIIVRQKGDKYKLGPNTYKGKDFTIHAGIDGVVFFSKKKVARYDGRIYVKTYVDVKSPEGEKKKEVKATKKIDLPTRAELKSAPKKTAKAVAEKTKEANLTKVAKEKPSPAKVAKKTATKKTTVTKAVSNTKKKAA